MAGADLKDAQAQMRHSRASTTADIYQQFVPESQRRAVNSLMELPTKRSDSVNYWSHFGATGDFRGLQMIDFMVPGARIAPWCHEPKPAHSFPYRGGRMRAASYFRQKPSSTGDVFTRIHGKNGGSMGIEFAVNLISPADSPALVSPDPPNMLLTERVFWPRCGHIARARDRPLTVAKGCLKGRAGRGRVGDLRVMRLEDSAKSR